MPFQVTTYLQAAQTT